MEVLAVAESDSYLKWVAWLLERAPPWWRSNICLVHSVISPSNRQVDRALAGTRRGRDDVPRLGALAVRRRILRDRPDVVVLAATGRTVAALTGSLLGHRAPVVVAGLPGVGLPVRAPALRSRAGIDVFVAHSRRERDEYTAGFEAIGLRPTVAVATLPFLTGERLPPLATDEGRIVFAAQPTVPPTRGDRVRVLERLVAAGPPAPVVELRGAGGEIATHDEPHPYPRLWDELVAGGAPAGGIEFEVGAMTDALRRASCLVTVSSTAALEAIDRGRPVLIVDEFGVDDELLNGVFTGSGLLGPLCREAIAAAGRPDPTWMECNYFHPDVEDDWIDAVERAAATDRARIRRRSADVGSTARGFVRVVAGWGLRRQVCR